MNKRMLGAQHSEPGTSPYSYHGVFTDQFFFFWNSDPHRDLSDQLQSHGHDVDMFTRGHIVLSLPKRAHVD